MAKLKGYVLLGLALLLCPCHLPLVLLLVGGTAAGALLRDYLPVALLVAGVGFVAALVSGLRLLEQPATTQTCPANGGLALPAAASAAHGRQSLSGIPSTAATDPARREPAGARR